MGDLRSVIDQMGQEVTFSYPPTRIVSLVPSQTEFLIDIGANVVGRTKFCIHPAEKVGDIPIIGGTKNFRLDSIRELSPDLIIGNKEENYQEGIALLKEDFPVWMSEIYTLDDAFTMMERLGSLCRKEEKAKLISNECRNVMKAMQGVRSGSAVYLIWQNPWMAAGKNTFIDHMLTHLGYQNLITSDRYPEISLEEIAKLNPDWVLLSSEPYPFKSKDLSLVKDFLKHPNVELVDGELFSWYGSRLKQWLTN